MRTSAGGSIPVFIATALIVVSGGCSDVFGTDSLGITITFSDSVVAPDQPVIVTVTVMNLGESVVWGRGSSSCQVGALVLTGTDEYRIDLGRLCTEDLSPQGLARGESLTEHWFWNGDALIDGVPVVLPPDTYQAVAVAGTKIRSEPRGIRVGTDESQ